MAIFHAATITPTKAELIAGWAPTQPWGPPATDALAVVGSYRFDDPEGRVGMEVHLVTAGGTTFQRLMQNLNNAINMISSAQVMSAEMNKNIIAGIR